MTSSLQFLPFHSILADPKDMHSAEKARLEMLLRKIAVFWVGQVARPHSTAHPSGTASQSGREGRKIRVRDTWLHIFSLADSSRRFLEPGAKQGFPKGACNCACRQKKKKKKFFLNSLKCQLCSEVCSLLHDTISEEEGRKGQHCMTDVLVP